MDSAYLNAVLGTALGQCMAEMVTISPLDPIEWIALWLYRYRDHEQYFHEKSVFNKELCLERDAEKKVKDEYKACIDAGRTNIKKLKARIAANYEYMSKLRKSLGPASLMGIKMTGGPDPKEKDSKRGRKSSSSRLSSMMSRVTNLLHPPPNIVHVHGKKEKAIDESESEEESDMTDSSSTGFDDSTFFGHEDLHETRFIEPEFGISGPPKLSQFTARKSAFSKDSRKSAMGRPSMFGRGGRKSKAVKGSLSPTHFDHHAPHPGHADADHARKHVQEHPKAHGMAGTPHGLDDTRTSRREKDLAAMQKAVAEGQHDSHHRKKPRTGSREDGHRNREDGHQSREDRERKDAKRLKEASSSIITVSNWQEKVASSMGISLTELEDNFYERHPELEHMSTREQTSTDASSTQRRESNVKSQRRRKTNTAPEDIDPQGTARMRPPDSRGYKKKRPDGADVSTASSEDGSRMRSSKGSIRNRGSKGSQYIDAVPKDVENDGVKVSWLEEEEVVQVSTWCLDCNLGLVCDHPILGQMRARCPIVFPESPAVWEQKGYAVENLYDHEIYSKESDADYGQEEEN